MNEPSIDELDAAIEYDEVEARILERQLDVLAPAQGPWNRLGNVELRCAEYEDSDLGRTRFHADFARRRRDYLLERYEHFSAEARRRDRWDRAAAQGLDRFIGDGRFTLDDLTEAAPGAMAVEKAKERVARLTADIRPREDR